MITARITLEVPRETVVVVADTRQAVDNIVEALREDGAYGDHAIVEDPQDDQLVRYDRGGWISGPCLDVHSLDVHSLDVRGEP